MDAKNKADYTNTFCFLMNENFLIIKFIMMKNFYLERKMGRSLKIK